MPDTDTDTDIVVVSVLSAASNMIELHETVVTTAGATVMQQKQGGFTVPTNGSSELVPGADHIMLVGLTAPLPAGTESTFTLTLSDGSEFIFTAAAKDDAGANESYESATDMEANK